MAKRRDVDKEDGVIIDQEGVVRHDAGEQLKDDYDRANAYEKDRIELRGIVFFTIGLVVICAVSFFLMWLMQEAMEAEAKRNDISSPMALGKEEALPPEPRLQGAPGFGVDRRDGGRESLELRDPQSEYRVLWRDWEKTWKEGRKDPQTGTVITLPMEEAKQKVLQQGIGKTRAPEQAQQSLLEARQAFSYSSSGRTKELRQY